MTFLINSRAYVLRIVSSITDDRTIYSSKTLAVSYHHKMVE